MNDSALTSYLRTCRRRLHQQQVALVDSLSLRTCQDIEIHPASGTMSLDLPGRGRAIATVTPIARYHTTSQTWQWSWAAQAPFSLLGHSASALQSLAKATGLNLFTMDQIQLSLDQTALVLAMACHQLRANGYYRWPDKEAFVFFAINHMALAAAPLDYSTNGDRLSLSGSDIQPAGLCRESQGQETSCKAPRCKEGIQQIRPSPSLLGEVSPAPVWPTQRDIEGFFAHLLHPQRSAASVCESVGLRQVGLKELAAEACES